MKISYQQCESNTGCILNGPLLIKPNINIDSRGFFQESWNEKDFNNILIKNNQDNQVFKQDNHSKSTKGTLRGLHYQKEPYSQGKLVRCISGEIFDVAVDIRKGSKTFLNYTSVILSSKNFMQFWIPKGFAHGFLTLSDNTEVIYKVTSYWHKESELSINWNDPKINIKWPSEDIKYLNISDKDSKAPYMPQIKKEDLL